MIRSRREFLSDSAVVLAGAAVLADPAALLAAPQPAKWPIGCFNRPWAQWPFAETLKSVKAAGYELTGLLTRTKMDPFIADDATPEYLQGLKAAIAASGVKAIMGALRSRHDGPLEQTAASLHKQIDNAAFLGLKSVMTFGIDNPDQFEHYFKSMADAAAYGQGKGVQVVMKPHGGSSGSSAEIIAAMKKVNHPNFSIWYDAGNIIYYTGKDPIEELKPIVQYVTGFCAKDCGQPKGDVMIQFGTGKVDFKGVFQVLKGAGFNGPIMVEGVAGGETPEAVAANARANREFLEKVIASLEPVRTVTMTYDSTRRDFLKISAGAVGAALGLRAIDLGAQGGLAARLGVCSWSLQPTSADDLFTKLAATGLTRVQIALDPIRSNEGGGWADFGARASKRGVSLVSGMIGTVGEDYSTLDSIRRTGGVVPDATWPETWKNIQADADVAGRLGLGLVTFHAGFLPHEESDPTFAKLQGRLRQVADLFAARKMAIALETGQEEASTLATFLKKLERQNVGVNFDPANMILYDKGDPVAALRTLGPWLRQCHLKDAVRTKTPGEWGEEVRLGTGQVDWKAFFSTLDAVGYKGDLCIEREAGKERVADIRAAREYVQKLQGTGRP